MMPFHQFSVKDHRFIHYAHAEKNAAGFTACKAKAIINGYRQQNNTVDSNETGVKKC